MNHHWKQFLSGTALIAMTVLPTAVKADEMSLKINLKEDDEAHFHFNGGKHQHHPMILKAASQLRNAKHTLWKTDNDFQGHKAAAIGHINAALDELRQADEVR